MRVIITRARLSFFSFFAVLFALSVPARAASANQGDGNLLDALTSPIILRGNTHRAFRDPLLAYENGVFYLFYSYVHEEKHHLIYWYVGESTSRDLKHWSYPHPITPRGQELNYSSPGSLVHIGDEWILCLQTYPIVNMHRGDPLRFGDSRSRIFISRSRNLTSWSPPLMIKVKGPTVSERDMGTMIDPFILQDKDNPGKWWCLYKQKGMIHASWSNDLVTWVLSDIVIANGENPDVIVQGKDYVLFYAPDNGIGVKRSPDMRQWRDAGPPITLGQSDWAWAKTRITAGYVADMRDVPGIGKYILVCHSMGPGEDKTDANTNANCSIVIAWSDDLKTWHWPGEPKGH